MNANEMLNLTPEELQKQLEMDFANDPERDEKIKVSKDLFQTMKDINEINRVYGGLHGNDPIEKAACIKIVEGYCDSVASTKKFINDYLNGEFRATAKEFLNAKIAEAQDNTTNLVTGFELSVTNQFDNGLDDLDKDDSDKDEVHYAISDMHLLWDSIINTESQLVY
jgi:hypothetical protein